MDFIFFFGHVKRKKSEMCMQQVSSEEPLVSSLPPKVLKISRAQRPQRGWPPPTKDKARTGVGVWPAGGSEIQVGERGTTEQPLKAGWQGAQVLKETLEDPWQQGKKKRLQFALSLQ